MSDLANVLGMCISENDNNITLLLRSSGKDGTENYQRVEMNKANKQILDTTTLTEKEYIEQSVILSHFPGVRFFCYRK